MYRHFRFNAWNLLNVEMCGYFLSQTEHKAPDNIFQ